MLDLLIYREAAKVSPNEGPHSYMICGKSCLAGDVFGEFRFAEELKVATASRFRTPRLHHGSRRTGSTA